MLMQTLDQQTTGQQLMVVDRYCSSIICHLEFHRLSTIVEIAVSAHQNTHTEKALFTF